MIEQRYIDMINITLENNLAYTKYSVKKFSNSNTFVYATLKFDYSTTTSIYSFTPYDFITFRKDYHTFSGYHYNIFVDRFINKSNGHIYSEREFKDITEIYNHITTDDSFFVYRVL